MIQNSKLQDQIIKKSKVLSPMLASFGDVLKSSSWGKERFPEYIWMALIHKYYGRNDGSKKIIDILNYILTNCDNVNSPTLSEVFLSTEIYTEDLYKYIMKVIKINLFAPITAILSAKEYPVFFKYFYNSKYELERRTSLLTEVINQYSDSDSENGTDIRFFPIYFLIKKGKLKTCCENDIVIETLSEYLYTPHSDEKMKIYRPTIRSMEMGMELAMETNNKSFVSLFWRQMADMCECNLLAINFPKSQEDYKNFISDTKEMITYLNTNHKTDSAIGKKYNVIIGMLTYSFKSFIETYEHNLSNCIMGRFAVRTIIECYIMLKYLLKNEDSVADIWGKYQAYGIGKYKLILLKVREKSILKESHVSEAVLNAIVNEEILEEYTEIDLRYFDQKGIREKAIEIGEKDLYDIYYDYDSNYSHGLWGAVRESSMLHCSNSAHGFHSVPDSNNDQHLLGVLFDCMEMFSKIILLINDIYSLPQWYLDKYFKR